MSQEPFMARRVFRISASAITRSNARSTASVSVLADRIALAFLIFATGKINCFRALFSGRTVPSSGLAALSAMCIVKGDHTHVKRASFPRQSVNKKAGSVTTIGPVWVLCQSRDRAHAGRVRSQERPAAKDVWRSTTKQQSPTKNLTTVSHVRRKPKAHENTVPLP